MGEVINLQEKLKKKGKIYSFILCPHCENETNMAVIVAMLDNGNCVSSLLCCGPECNGEGLEIEIKGEFIQSGKEITHE